MSKTRPPYPPEFRAEAVRLARSSGLALPELARELGLATLVRLGEGELAAAPEPRPSILADALEAVFGAIFIDGGYEAARAAALTAFGARLDALDPDRAAKDAKTELQERLQAALGGSAVCRGGHWAMQSLRR